MPYIITTNAGIEPGRHVRVNGRPGIVRAVFENVMRVEYRSRAGSFLENVDRRDVQPLLIGTQRAVATLDEARDTAFARMADVPHYPLADAARLSDAIHALPETGGTIGPLPDGTTIEVRRVDLIELRKLAGLPIGWYSTAAVIDAFNTRNS